MNVETHNLAVRIYDALNKKGADLGDAAIGIIESAVEESAQQNMHWTGLTPLAKKEVEEIVMRALATGSV